MPTPYIPIELPLDNLDLNVLFSLATEATRELSRYDGLLEGLINPAVLLSPVITKEATLSSKIEGTQATFGEVLSYEAGERYQEDKVNDIHEVLNYRKALNLGEYLIDQRETITLSSVKAMHQELMESVRGQDKSPGFFRTDQNWIGSIGCTMDEASFVPPSPLQLMDFLEKWELYILSEDLNELIQTAVMHAQFELIHPFMDGNGRVGRMLIPLYLYYKKALHRPCFYLSEYLERNREEYYARLGAISREGGWQGWIEFFLKAIIEQAKENTYKVKGLNRLYEALKESFIEATHSQHAQRALDAFFTMPVLNSTDFMKLSHIPNRATAGSILRALTEKGIIDVVSSNSGSKPATYACKLIIHVAEHGWDTE